MRTDPLYILLEKHLQNSLLETESTEDLVAKIVQEYMTGLANDGIIPEPLRAAIETDLKEEAMEMLRKKTYGHYNLSEFRKAQKARQSPAHSAGQENTRAIPSQKSTLRRRRPS